MIRNIPRLYLIRTLFWMHFFSAVIIPFYTGWGGITLAQVFYLNAWFFFWNFVLEVPTGTVADFFGRKVSLVAGSAVGLIACLVYASHPGLPTFMGAEVLFAIAYTLHSGADEALAYDSLAAEGRAAEARRVIARMEAFKLGGIMASALIGGAVAGLFGVRSTMRAYAIPSVLGILVALTLREPPLSAPAENREKCGYADILREGFRYFFRNRILLLLTADMALTNAVAWSLIWTYQALLGRAGLPIPAFGAVHMAMCAGQIAFLRNVDWIERKLGSKLRLLLAGSVVCGAAFILLGVNERLPIVIGGIIVAASFGLPRIAIFSAYLNNHIPSDKRATVLSISSMLRTLAIVVMNPISGRLAQRSLNLAMLTLGGALILLPLLSRVEERHLEENRGALPG